MRTLRITTCLLSGLLLAGAVGTARADVFNLTDTAQGWVRFDNVNNGVSATNNYIAGDCTATCAVPGNYRDWFEFALPSLGGTLTSATLQLFEPSGAGAGHVGGPQTFSVYGLSARPIAFSDIAPSNLFGSVATSTASNGTIVNITLNAAALAAIGADQGGNVFIGGIDSGENVAAFDFGSSQNNNSTLVLTTTAAVPEPSSLVLVGSGLLGLAALSRRPIRSRSAR